MGIKGIGIKYNKLICQHCKKEFLPILASKNYKQKFCSIECKKHQFKYFGKEQRVKLWNKLKGTHRALEKRNCLYCNKEFEVIKSDRKKYCSRSCAGKNNYKNKVIFLQFSNNIGTRNQQKEYKEKIIKGKLEYYKKNPVKLQKWYLNKFGENYKPIPKHSKEWKELSNKLRLNWYCHNCGSKENLIVHHIIPFSINKDNSLENLVVLCKRCHTPIEAKGRCIYNFIKDWETTRDIIRNYFFENGYKIVISKEYENKINASELNG